MSLQGKVCGPSSTVRHVHLTPRCKLIPLILISFSSFCMEGFHKYLVPFGVVSRRSGRVKERAAIRAQHCCESHLGRRNDSQLSTSQ